jgi:riboflavin kinase / FMN adenylyltransferase
MALHHLHWTDPFPAAVRGGAISLGNFDGVHTGHQLLVRRLAEWAARVHGPAVAVTFDPPPVALLNPAALKLPLTTIADRSDLLHAAGATEVVALVSEASLLALNPPAFIEDVIQGQFDARAIVEGSNFRFGRNREGTNNHLNTLEHRSNIHFEEIHVPGEGVSSSKVRDAINAGDICTANAMLGRPYCICGRVVPGAQRGRTLGVPTANLADVPTLVPKVGVYAGRVHIDNITYPCAIHIGPNPTFGEDARKIEAHVIHYSGDLYDRDLTLHFECRLRDTRPFASVAELTAQLQADITAAKGVLG